MADFLHSDNFWWCDRMSFIYSNGPVFFISLFTCYQILYAALSQRLIPTGFSLSVQWYHIPRCMTEKSHGPMSTVIIHLLKVLHRVGKSCLQRMLKSLLWSRGVGKTYLGYQCELYFQRPCRTKWSVFSAPNSTLVGQVFACLLDPELCRSWEMFCCGGINTEINPSSGRWAAFGVFLW